MSENYIPVTVQFIDEIYDENDRYVKRTRYFYDTLYPVLPRIGDSIAVDETDSPQSECLAIADVQRINFESVAGKPTSRIVIITEADKSGQSVGEWEKALPKLKAAGFYGFEEWT